MKTSPLRVGRNSNLKINALLQAQNDWDQVVPGEEEELPHELVMEQEVVVVVLAHTREDDVRPAHVGSRHRVSERVQRIHAAGHRSRCAGTHVVHVHVVHVGSLASSGGSGPLAHTDGAVAVSLSQTTLRDPALVHGRRFHGVVLDLQDGRPVTTYLPYNF